MEHITAVGSDGTVVNTGWKSGIIRKIEESLGHSVQWIICLLHINELPLRHIFQKLDGTTAGPSAFTGPIGLKLKGAQNQPISNFKPIKIDLSNVEKISNELSTDQKYLFQICTAISNGCITPNLAQKNPGPINHARWLTMANNVLRLYVSESEPSQNLQLISEYIMKVYAPSWFDIKCSSNLHNAPRNFFKIVERCRFLPPDLLLIVKKVLQRNSYSLHPENILLAMLWDKNIEIRKRAAEKILKSRQELKKPGIRFFKVPLINFDAHNFTELVDLDNVIITQPPIVDGCSDDEIKSLVDLYDNSCIYNFAMIPCHNQAVERCIKVVTESSLEVCGAENRDGLIRNVLNSRCIMPIFSSKNDYKFID